MVDSSYKAVRDALLTELAAEFESGASNSEDVFLFAKETRERLRAQTVAEVVGFLRGAGNTRFWNECFKAAAVVIERELGKN